jgi:hypothetical protein
MSRRDGEDGIIVSNVNLFNDINYRAMKKEDLFYSRRLA